MGQGSKWLVVKGILKFSLRLPTADVEIAPGQKRFDEFFSEVDGIRRICFSAFQAFDPYPEGVNARMPPPVIPAEALARQAHLQLALQGMEATGASREPQPLQELQAVLAGRTLLDPMALIADFIAADLVEEAGELLRASRRAIVTSELFETLHSGLVPLVTKARQRRSASWHLDTRRSLIRLQYAKEGAALDFDDGDLHAIFLQAFRLEGLRLALDLGKRPRPLLTMGLPLSAGVGAHAESLDAVLKLEPREDSADLMARLNHRLQEGLRVHQWDVLPAYASSVGDLAVRSQWCWKPAPKDRVHAEKKVTAFLAAANWPWHRDRAKVDATLDLRLVVQDLRWEGPALCFSTRMGAFYALNPVKMLMAILDLDQFSLQGLVRTAVDLRPDVRLGQAERFEPKLKNMYEDAVLLGGGSNIVLVDEDDDEPIRLGPPSDGT
jgi:hypothetical protein